MTIPGYNTFLKNARKYGFSLFGTPKTGQVIQYAAGDDGAYQKGYPKTGARFTDNGDGTITDNGTGLTWAKDGNGAGCNNGAEIAWAAALAYCEGLNFAGYTDWRLPNIKELMTLLDMNNTPIYIDPLFVNTHTGYYFSSTTKSSDTDYAFYVSFADAFAADIDKTEPKHIRAVRGG